jgi:hypothetical protein
MISRFKTALTDSLAFMNRNPEGLEEHQTEIIDRMIDYMDSDGQGSGNEVKAHEACIADALECHGFVMAGRNVVPAADGLYYWYQPAGSQASGDFELFCVEHGEKTFSVLIDAKHTNLAMFYLNDGWFNPDTIYVVSFSVSAGRGLGRKKVCFIGLGRDIPTEKDSSIMAYYNDFKRTENARRKDMEPDFLSIYVRFANQYSTKQFTPEFLTDRFEKTMAWIQSRAVQCVL